MSPGLYSTKFGFYSNKQINAKVFLNGELVIVANDKTAKNGRSKLQHSAGNVCGLTFSDIVALPERARITISYDSEGVGEGFLIIRKIWALIEII